MKWFPVALALIAVAIDLITQVTGSSLTFLAGMALVYVGERMFSADDLHWVLTGGGLAIVLLSGALRMRLWMGAEGARREAHSRALAYQTISATSLAFYGMTSHKVTDLVGMADPTLTKWVTVLEALSPMIFLLGAIPAFLLDRALAQHPVLLPMGAARRAIEAGLAAALGISLVFPLNYIASVHHYDYDYAYFKVADPGTSTLALASTLTDPVNCYLFFPVGSDVGVEIAPYFDKLEAESQGKLVLQVVDQALVPEVAAKLKIRENGYIVFEKGDQVEKFKLGTDLDKARHDLKKLDENVQKYLLKVAKGARTAYLTTGHGEASTKEADDPFKKFNTFKQILESQNYKVKNLGIPEGLSEAVPDDAAMVIIGAPEKPFFPEEETAIENYLDKGGKLMVMVTPGQEPLAGILGHMGLKADTFPLANMKSHMATKGGGKADREILFSNRFGSHAAVTTLSKNSTQMAVILPNTTALQETKEGPAKATVLVRSMPDSWEDTDGDIEDGPTEKADVFNIAYASTAGEGDQAWRAIAIGNSAAFSDVLLQNNVGNAQLALDGLRWMVGDEALAGNTNNEDDINIEHTKDEDTAWFYGTIFAVPLLIMGLGLVFTTTRQRRSK